MTSGKHRSAAAGLFRSLCLLSFLLLASTAAFSDAVAVRYAEGGLHGFLALRDMQGRKIADGELTQRIEGQHIKLRIIFRFRDGSLYDDNVTFSQRGNFRVLSENLVEKGPSFKHPTNTSIDATNGQVKVRSIDEKGKEQYLDEKIDIPIDLANGIIPILMKNVRPDAPTTLSMLVTTPKPRIVKLKVSADGEDPVLVAGATAKAIRYRGQIDIGGVTGLAAKIADKEPADLYFWVLKSETPVFLKMQGQLYQDGPIWTMELSTPSWPKTNVSKK